MSDFRPSKKLGQNFLTDKNLAARIAEAAGAAEDRLVLEIGPGEGILTRALLDRGCRVVAVEKDFRLYEKLVETFASEKRLALLRQDVLEIDLHALLGEHLKSGEKALVAANLPYSISTQALFAFLDVADLLEAITVLLQKEVAERISAGPGSRTYGSISAAIALHGKAKLLFKVGPGAFRPRPRVDSALVRISLAPLADPETLGGARRVVRAAFARRRKRLRNSLLESGKFKGREERLDAALAAAGIDPATRAEQLSAEDFLKLARALDEARGT